jgi:hypothetical protein
MGKYQKEKELDISKFLLSDFRKKEVENQCKLKDLQPFLKYSAWYFFWPRVEELIKGCRASLNFLSHSIGKLQVLDEEKILEHLIIQDLSNALSKLNAPKQNTQRVFKVKALKESSDAHLYELFSRRRKYSRFF